MDTLYVSLFGQFQVRCGTENLTNRYPRKLQELLSYLFLQRDRTHPREMLASQFWGDSSTTQSRRYLRQALWQLQVTVNNHGCCADEHVLLADPEQVHLNPDLDLWLDVEVLERAYSWSRGVPGRAFDAARAQALHEALDVYRGDLLEGWYQDWCLSERERLQRIFLSGLEKLMDYCETRQEYETGVGYGLRALHYDQAREPTHRRLMRLYHLSGDRTAALRQYESCLDALRRELAIRPTAATQTLYEKIRADSLPSAPQPRAARVQPREAPADRWTDLLRQLRQLDSRLTELSGDLQALMALAESAARDEIR